MDKDKAIIGVYDSHLQAIEAIKILKKNHFPTKHIALIGKGEAVKEIDGVLTWEDVTVKGAEIGSLIGGALGVLAGLSLIAIPGLGVVYIGGLLGALIGGAEGVAAGGSLGFILGSILGYQVGPEGLVSGKEDRADLKKYKKEIEDGHFLLIVRGPEKEMEQAHQILSDAAHHIQLDHFTGFN